MKKFLIFFISLIIGIVMVVMISACNDTPSTRPVDTDTFEIVDSWNADDGGLYSYYKVYDKQTKVMYLIITNNGGYAGGIAITVLYGEDGKPLVYKE